MAIGDVLIIFVKYPEPGSVKTRLVKALGAEEAARLYRLMAENTVRRLALKGCGQYETIIFFDPPDRAVHVRGWLGDGQSYMQQSGRDLGQKLSNAFGTVFDSGARRVVVVGTDCPDITQEIVAKALEHLGERDMVIGPALDGGYYLLGLSRRAPELFESIDWSTDRVLKQTVEKARGLGMSFTTLKPLKDLDEPSDISPAHLHLLKQRT